MRRVRHPGPTPSISRSPESAHRVATWNAQEFAATGSRIEERGRRCDEMIESLSLLLTKSNATFTGRYYNFEDVTLDPRPSQMPELWVGGGSKTPDLQGRDQPKLAKTVADRIVKAGHWLSRAAGSQEMLKRDWQLLREHCRAMGKNPDSLVFGHCNFIHLVDTADEEKAAAESREPFLRVMAITANGTICGRPTSSARSTGYTPESRTSSMPAYNIWC